MQLRMIYTMGCVLSLAYNSYAQLSPPGLGDTKAAFWSALGVKQRLDAKDALLVYAGVGRVSGPQGSNLFNDPSIAVVNAELYHTLSPSLKYSYALSYRRQDHYDYSLTDYADAPTVTQEFRAYGRVSYSLKASFAKYSLTLRQEVREFFDTGFTPDSNELQLRTRLKAGMAIPLDNHGNSLTGTAETLFSVTNKNGWDTFGYKESRFCLYYTYAPASAPVVFDVGYMNDLVGQGHGHTDAGYLAIDVVLVDVF